MFQYSRKRSTGAIPAGTRLIIGNRSGMTPGSDRPFYTIIRKNIMVLVKCFETRHMPEEVYVQIADILHDDTGVYWVVRCDEPNTVYDWFIANGANDGEKVLIERGVWA